MTELELIVDLHRHTNRQGPGSAADTLRALSYLDLAGRSQLTVADIGCGTGGQTLTLAQHINGKIIGVDLFTPFLDELVTKANRIGLSEKIQVLESSMESLPIDEHSLDVIWSEGAIYNMGFENGIKAWHKLLKPGGYLAISEIIWLTDERPKVLEDYWNSAYPEMDTAANKKKIMKDHGYTLTGYFDLKPESWTETYYKPLQASFDSFMQKHNGSELAQKVIRDYEEEIALFNTYKAYYSYGFFIAQKR